MSNSVSERLSEIRERVEAATEGPWEVVRETSHGPVKIRAPEAVGNVIAEALDSQMAAQEGYHDTRDERIANAHLIASARSDVPWLLDKLTEMANAAHDLLSDLEHADEWGHEAAQPSLDQSRERLEQKIAALRDAAQEGAE